MGLEEGKKASLSLSLSHTHTHTHTLTLISYLKYLLY